MSFLVEILGFLVLFFLEDLVESTGIWPQGLLDAYIAMISEADGDSTPQGQRPLSVLPVVYRLWASLRLGHLRKWVEGWLPKSVFSLANGSSSVGAGSLLRWILRRISLIVLVLVLFLVGLVRLLSGSLLLVRYLWDFRLSWAGSW